MQPGAKAPDPHAEAIGIVVAKGVGDVSE
jgi:hypothetical protein